MRKMDKLQELEMMAKQAVKELRKDFTSVIEDSQEKYLSEIEEDGRGRGFVRYEMECGKYTMDYEVDYYATYDGELFELEDEYSVVYVYTTEQDQQNGIDDIVSFKVDLPR